MVRAGIWVGVGLTVALILGRLLFGGVQDASLAAGKVAGVGESGAGGVRHVQEAPRADGDLDPTFGTGGVATLRLPRLVDGTGYRLARQADGKLVLAGWVDSNPDALGILRLNADGSLDPTFGTGGQTLVVFDEPGLYPYFYLTFAALAIQADGKILVAGTGEGPATYQDWALARVLPDGSLDATFGQAGKVRVDFGAQSDDVAGGLALQPDGKILVTGTARPSGGSGQLALARLLANGSLDLTFDGDGLVTTTFGNYAMGNALVVQPNGQIVAGGTVQPATQLDFALARYNADGSLDTTFGTGGLATTDFGASDQIFSLALAGNGTITALGETRSDSANSNFALARYLPGGSLDPTFGTGGTTTTDLGGNDTGYGLALLADGRLVAAGRTGPSGGFDVGLARYLANGAPDPSFGTGGQVVSDLGGIDVATGALPNADGTMLVGGYTRIPGGTRPLVARYLPGGSLDPAFGSGGYVTPPVFWSNAASLAVARQPDGKVVVVGSAGGSRSVVVRFTATGQPDPTFGVSGVVTPTLTGYSVYLSDVLIQPDGKIVAAGQRNDGTEGDTLLLRLLPDGTLDPTFGTGGYGRIDVNFSSDDAANAVALQPDGKLVTAGYADDIGYVATRFLPSGLPDASFNGSGWNYIGGLPTEATDLALQPDGKVVMVGLLAGSSGPAQFGTGRLLADGQRDTTFGTNGLVLTDFPNPYDFAFADGVAVQADGKIVVAGTVESPTNYAIGLLRLLPNGTPDTTFGTGGLVAVVLANGGGANALALDGAGRLLVSGAGLLSRFLSNGTLDPSFGTGGSITPPAGIVALAGPADGTLVAAGPLRVGADRVIAVMRFLYDTGPPATPTGSVTPPPTATPVTPSATPTPPCGGSWTSVPVPTLSANSHLLEAVTARTNSDVWAVGRYVTSQGASDSLTTHWNGQAWQLVPSPTRFGTTYLNGVAAVSANDVWAVGYDTQGTLILHWDGATWQIVPSPNGPSQNELHAVTAVAANDVWAVGTTSASSNTEQTLILHWDGATWTRASSPNSVLPLNELYAVAALGPNDIWAVGTAAPVPDVRYDSLTLHWNGSAWSVVASPNSATTFNMLYGVAGVAANDVWAVGQSQALHWDGSAWTDVPRPAGRLTGVAALGTGNVWAVGSIWNVGLGRTDTLTEHWDGAQWVIVPSPTGPSDTELDGVAAITANEIWAVGTGGASAGQPYSLRWSANCPTGTATPLRTPSATTTASPIRTLSATATPIRTLSATATASPIRTPSATATASPIRTLSATATASPIRTASPTNTAAVQHTASPAPSPTATACTIQFSDVPLTDPFYPFIRCLACRGIVNGYADGTFRPGAVVTRGQLAKILASAAGLSDAIPSTQQTFEDVPSSNAFWLFVERLAGTGAISGYACGGVGEPCVPPGNRPYFRWTANATRGQIAKITAVAARIQDPIPPGQQTFVDVPSSNPFWLWIEQLAGRGAISGYTCGGVGEPCVPPGNRPYFRWGANATRGQMTKIATLIFFPNCQTPVRH